MADLSTFPNAVAALSDAGLSKGFIAERLGVTAGTLSRMLREPTPAQRADRNYMAPPADWPARLAAAATAGAAHLLRDAEAKAAALRLLARALSPSPDPQQVEPAPPAVPPSRQLQERLRAVVEPYTKERQTRKARRTRGEG